MSDMVIVDVKIIGIQGSGNYIMLYLLDGCKLFRTIKRIRLDEIINIYIGINSSKLFDKFNIPSSNDQQCMSIFCENKVLALQNDNEATIKSWYYALNYLINHNKIKDQLIDNHENHNLNLKTVNNDYENHLLSQNITEYEQ